DRATPRSAARARSAPQPHAPAGRWSITSSGSAHVIDVPGAPGCFPRLRPLPLPRRSRFGGTFPGRSSEEGGIEEFPLLRPSRRLRSATSARSSSIACPCSAITASRAAHAPHPAAGSGGSVTDHHDHDIPAVIKSTRWAGSVKIPAPVLSLSARGVNVYVHFLPDRLAGEDVQHHVQVEPDAPPRAFQLRDIPGPHLGRAGGHQLGPHPNTFNLRLQRCKIAV